MLRAACLAIICLGVMTGAGLAGTRLFTITLSDSEERGAQHHIESDNPACTASLAPTQPGHSADVVLDCSQSDSPGSARFSLFERMLLSGEWRVLDVTIRRTEPGPITTQRLPRRDAKNIWTEFTLQTSARRSLHVSVTLRAIGLDPDSLACGRGTRSRLEGGTLTNPVEFNIFCATNADCDPDAHCAFCGGLCVKN
jgi:hypothetical protein